MSTPYLSFTIPGPPVALERSARTVRHGRVHTYESAAMKRAKRVVRDCAALAMMRARLTMFPQHKPIALHVSFFMPTPKNVKAPGWHVKKPDLSNLLKLIEDAMNGVVWHDDGQVCEVHMCKQVNDLPRTVISVTSSCLNSPRHFK